MTLHPLPQCSEMAWAGGEASHVRLPPFCADDWISVSAPHGVCLTFSEHVHCTINISGRSAWRDVPRGCVSINGPDPIAWLKVREPSDVVEIVASAGFRRAVSEELSAPSAELGDLHGGHDPVIWAVAARFRVALLHRAELSDIERDELLYLLYRRVFLRRFGGRSSSKGDGALDERRLRRVIDFVDANLDSALTVADLAEVASLSRFHFIRSFKCRTGITPHQFVQGRRLERARLELDAGAGINIVARRAGFSHLRHFSTVYCRHHGLSPT
jgi:AraC-like DNA-binding protein